MNLHVVQAQKYFLNECIMLRFSEFIIKLLLKSQNLNHLPFLPLLVSFIGLPSLLLQYLLTPECILITKALWFLPPWSLAFVRETCSLVTVLLALVCGVFAQFLASSVSLLHLIRLILKAYDIIFLCNTLNSSHCLLPTNLEFLWFAVPIVWPYQLCLLTFLFDSILQPNQASLQSSNIFPLLYHLLSSLPGMIFSPMSAC